MQHNPSSPAPNPATSHSRLQATRMCDCRLKIFPTKCNVSGFILRMEMPRQDAEEGAGSQRYQEWNQDQRDPSGKWRTGEKTWVKKWIRPMDTKEQQENNKWLWQSLKQAWLFYLFFFSFPPSLSRAYILIHPLILPENVFTWSIFCFTWHTALAQPFLLSIHLRNISALQCQPCSSFEPCLSLRLKLRWWFTDRASSLPRIPTLVPALL